MRRDIRTIVVGLDFSEASVEALGEARHLAHRLGARIVVVHAVQVHLTEQTAIPGPTAGPALEDPSRHLERAREAARRSFDALLAREDLRDLGGEVRVGDPVTVLLEVAAELDADMLVIGTHGRRGLARLVLGSVAERVLRESGRPVLVVPAKDCAQAGSE